MRGHIDILGRRYRSSTTNLPELVSREDMEGAVTRSVVRVPWLDASDAHPLHPTIGNLTDHTEIQEKN